MTKEGQTEQEYSSKMAEQMKEVYAQMPYFPAEIKQAENFYAVQITADAGFFYAKEFGNHGLYGNGYCWEGLLEQLIAKEQKSLLTKIEFDSEADTCFMLCKDEKSMRQLAEFIKAHLSGVKDFTIALNKIDKSKLDC